MLFLNFGGKIIDQPHQIPCSCTQEHVSLYTISDKVKKVNWGKIELSNGKKRYQTTTLDAAVLANFCTAGCPKQGVLSNNNFKAYLSC